MPLEKETVTATFILRTGMAMERSIELLTITIWTEITMLMSNTSSLKKMTSYSLAWARDYGDDNKLWYDVNYEYIQEDCQWLTDFNGDEMFVYRFNYNCAENLLTPTSEIAFSFYDLDGDDYSEEAIRFFGSGNRGQIVAV